jgi:hypothetical protein
MGQHQVKILTKNDNRFLSPNCKLFQNVPNKIPRPSRLHPGVGHQRPPTTFTQSHSDRCCQKWINRRANQEFVSPLPPILLHAPMVHLQKISHWLGPPMLEVAEFLHLVSFQTEKEQNFRAKDNIGFWAANLYQDCLDTKKSLPIVIAGKTKVTWFFDTTTKEKWKQHIFGLCRGFS